MVRGKHIRTHSRFSKSPLSMALEFFIPLPLLVGSGTDSKMTVLSSTLGNGKSAPWNCVVS